MTSAIKSKTEPSFESSHAQKIEANYRSIRHHSDLLPRMALPEKVRTRITIEAPADIEPEDRIVLSEIEKTLGVRNVNVQLPDKGCGTVSLRHNEIHRITHECCVQDAHTLRFQFHYCGSRVSILLEFPEPLQADVATALQDAGKLSTVCSSQNDPSGDSLTNPLSENL